VETKPTNSVTSTEPLTALRDDPIARFSKIKSRCDELTREANAVRGQIAELDARRAQLAEQLKELKKQAKAAEMEIVAIARGMGQAVEKGESSPPLHIA